MKTKTRLAKIITTMLAVGLSLGAYSADNSIYIDQSGSNATLSITQDGYGNTVRGVGNGGNTLPATIYGINNQVTVNQVGISNTLSLGIQTTSGGSTVLPDGTTVNVPTINYSVTGNNATAIINSNNDGTGASQSAYIDVTQTGNSANANIDVRGNNNAVKVVTDGGANNSVVTTVNGNSNLQNISMTGGGNNTSATTQSGNNASINISSAGASNAFTIDQSGGTIGNSVTVQNYAGNGAMNGTGNTVTVAQSGGNDNTAVLSMSGSNNTVGVTQAAGAGNNVANIKVNGGSNAVTINQNNH